MVCIYKKYSHARRRAKVSTRFVGAMKIYCLLPIVRTGIGWSADGWFVPIYQDEEIRRQQEMTLVEHTQLLIDGSDRSVIRTRSCGKRPVDAHRFRVTNQEGEEDV